MTMGSAPSVSSAGTRPASGHMNYPGDVTGPIADHIATGDPMGPNYMGEFMWPVDAVYDPETDKTRVGFTFVPPPAVQ